MINANRELANNNVRIIRWAVWLEGYDFGIEHNPGYLNCVADLLTREVVDPQLKEEAVVGP